MKTIAYTYKEDNKSKRDSAILTTLISGAILLFIFLFRTTPSIEQRPEPIAIQFSDEVVTDPPRPQIKELIVPKPVERITKDAGGSPSRVAVGSNKDVSAKGTKNSSVNHERLKVKSNDVADNKEEIKAKPISAPKKETAKEENKSNNKSSNKALDNLLKNRNKTGGNGNRTHGNVDGNDGTTDGNGNGSGKGNGSGNGIGNGNKIGEGGRNLVSYIPGTMGKGGEMPAQNCNSTGRIWFEYTVDKSGKVISVNRKKGSSEPCLVQAGQNWIRKYVRANQGNSTATGTYDIEF